MLINDKRCFIVNKKCSSSEILEKMARSLVTDGLAKESFIKAVLEREDEHPTGIDCGDYSIATPHTDPAHILESGFAIAICNENILFYNADKSGQELKPSIIIMMCIKSTEAGNEHIEAIGRVYALAGNKDIIDILCNCLDPESISNIFNSNY